MQAAFSRSQLQRFDEWRRCRDENVRRFLQRLGSLSGLKLPTVLPERDHAWAPKPRQRKVVFKNTGSQDLCWLAGREEDRVGTDFDVSGDFSSAVISNGVLDTSTLAQGAYQATCSARST